MCSEAARRRSQFVRDLEEGRQSDAECAARPSRSAETRLKLLWGIAAWATRRLFAKKLALTGNSLVKFGDFLDPVFKLAVPLGQLLRYYIATTGRTPIHEVCGESDFLTGQKLVLCRWTAFGAHARILTHCKALQRQAIVTTPDKIAKNSALRPLRRQDANRFQHHRPVEAFWLLGWRTVGLLGHAGTSPLKPQPARFSKLTRNFDFWNPGPPEEQTNRKKRGRVR
jgi:hypothetical protein